jgi:hypothetical protein
METGNALFKLYHFTLPSPIGSAQHPCEFALCRINVAALLMNSHVRMWHVSNVIASFNWSGETAAGMD